MEFMTPKPILIERLHHCSSCEHKRGSGFTAQCAECGCFIEGKTRLSNQSCPLKKWTAIDAPETKPAKTQIIKHCCGGK